MSELRPVTAKQKTGAFLMGLVGACLLAGATFLAKSTWQDLGTRKQAPAVVEELVATKSPDGTTLYAPRFAFKDATGKEHRVTTSWSKGSPGYAKGQKIDILYPPSAPEKAIIDSFWSKWLWPIVGGGFGLLFLVLAPLAARKQPVPTGTAAVTLLPLEQRLDFHPLNAQTVDGYLAGATGTGMLPGGGITAGAMAIREGRCPVPLCEFCSYMAALVYADPKVIIEHLSAHCPDIRSPRFLSNQNTEGLAFLYEGRAFIVLRGTEEKRADWFRNFKALRTGPRDYIPLGVTWTAAARHSGFAEGWDVIRDQVEEWIRDMRQEHGPDIPFIFTGHSLGGALSFLGAYEFAKLGREVEAVITFGAALPGGPAFGREYEALGLGVRTLRLEFDKDAVPIAQFPLLYLPVGFAWQLDKPPLTGRERRTSERLKSGMVTLLQKGLSASSDSTPPLFRSPLMALLTVLVYGVPAAVAAVRAHSMQQRYALALSVLSYRRIRELVITQGSEGEYSDCYEKLCKHLDRLRGARPEDPKVFEFLKELPLRLTSKADFDALTAKFPDRLM